jgi:hypothetical protein
VNVSRIIVSFLSTVADTDVSIKNNILLSVCSYRYRCEHKE